MDAETKEKITAGLRLSREDKELNDSMRIIQRKIKEALATYSCMDSIDSWENKMMIRLVNVRTECNKASNLIGDSKKVNLAKKRERLKAVVDSIYRTCTDSIDALKSKEIEEFAMAMSESDTNLKEMADKLREEAGEL